MQTKPETGSEAGAEEQAETVELPTSAIGDTAVGDTITLKILSIDTESGKATAEVQDDEDTEDGGGSDQLASQITDQKA